VGLCMRHWLVCALLVGLLSFGLVPLYAIQDLTKTQHVHHLKHHRHHLRKKTQHHAVPSLAAYDLKQSSPITLGQTQVCSTAKSELGKPYVWGGDTPSDGFDCSGFSQYVYEQEGVRIPRTALQQYASLKPVHHLQNGDLVFFRTFGRSVSHVGIYLGNGYFIHSPKTGQDVRIDNIDDPYWRARYAGARRVLTNQA
jgi:cell wall-associated NlpC family hydrolase